MYMASELRYMKARATISKELSSEAVVQRCSVKKLFLKTLQNSQENTRAQLFSCEFAKFLRTLFFYRTPPVAASIGWEFLSFLFSRLFT